MVRRRGEKARRRPERAGGGQRRGLLSLSDDGLRRALAHVPLSSHAAFKNTCSRLYRLGCAASYRRERADSGCEESVLLVTGGTSSGGDEVLWSESTFVLGADGWRTRERQILNPMAGRSFERGGSRSGVHDRSGDTGCSGDNGCSAVVGDELLVAPRRRPGIRASIPFPPRRRNRNAHAKETRRSGPSSASGSRRAPSWPTTSSETAGATATRTRAGAAATSCPARPWPRAGASRPAAASTAASSSAEAASAFLFYARPPAFGRQERASALAPNAGLRRRDGAGGPRRRRGRRPRLHDGDHEPLQRLPAQDA